MNGVHPDCDRYNLDDIGYGNLFADAYKHMLIFVVERKKWLAYDGCKWALNEAVAMECCKQLVNAIYEWRIKNIRRYDADKDAVRAIKAITSRRARENILKDAATVYPVSFSEFDKDANLFNCLNGTIDLTTQTFRPHSPTDLITKVANVFYDPRAICQRWCQHIMEVTENNIETAKYIQKGLGYSLTGANELEQMFIMYGPKSRNGKSTTIEAFTHMMGDYARSARPETIAQKNFSNGSAPSEDLARLAGARVVSVSEPDKKMRLSAALVKSLTGNDTISARFLHENSFEFKAGFKLWLNTNYLPQVTDQTVFKSGRIKVIPFTHYFSKDQQDPTLKQMLMQPQNISGILNWCIEGLRLLHLEGFDEPASVIEATNGYGHDSNKVAQFISEALVHTPGINTSTDTVYEAYKAWCQDSGFYSQNRKVFLQELGDLITLDRTRNVGSVTAPNAIHCVLDYSLPKDAPLTDEQFNDAVKEYGIDLTNSNT